MILFALHYYLLLQFAGVAERAIPQKNKNAGVAELADALVSGSSEAIHVGSSPVACTNDRDFLGHFLFWKWRSKNLVFLSAS